MNQLLCLLLIFPMLFSSTSSNKVGKGLAMAYPQYPEDLQKLPVNWWYDWSSSHYEDSRYVPMSWCGADPNLSFDYSGYLLLFNEPEVETQCNITPQQGIDYYVALKDKYPDARFVVGNTIFWGGHQDWITSFWDLCSSNQSCIMPEYWGVHVYIGGDGWIQFIKDNLDGLHNKIGGTFWITEFAEINGNVEIDKEMVGLFNSLSYIDRWAYFTNRSQPDAPWVGWNIALFDWNTGEPTAIGNWYMEQPINTFLPMIAK